MKNKKAHCRACSFGKKRLNVPQENQKDKEIERKSRKETNLQGEASEPISSIREKVAFFEQHHPFFPLTQKIPILIVASDLIIKKIFCNIVRSTG
ncbi:MAG: hypothetical protein Q3M30_07025 [Candidatus Electrothrix sp. Rat3]|nr:hypothetical protein [Candidatus Electrothrix rattekaaiensis]